VSFFSLVDLPFFESLHHEIFFGGRKQSCCFIQQLDLVLVELALQLNCEHRNIQIFYEAKFVLASVQKRPFQNEVIDLRNQKNS
jgi:hypothetical protein